MKYRKRHGGRRRRTHQKKVKGKGFLKTLGDVGKFALNLAPLAIAALGRKRRGRRGKAPIITGQGTGNPFSIP